MSPSKIINCLLVLTVALLSALPKPAVAAPSERKDAPVYFNFNPQDVPKYDAVVVTACGLYFGDIKKAIHDHIFSTDKAAPLPEDSEHSLLPDSYVEDALNAMLTGAGKHYMVVPLRWTRNPEKTAVAEAQFQDWLSQVSAAAQASHKPLYVFAHSWGTVIMHHTLAVLAAQGSPVRVDKLITMGSPLAPANRAIQEFDRMELPAQDFGIQTSKPANVSSWTNFWAKRDIFSNAIPAADLNYRVDSGADLDQSLLAKACRDPKLTVRALKDLKTLDNFSYWHFSYFSGYHAALPTIDSQLDLDIPDADIMPNAF